MDAIQRALIKAGRRDLAQKYYEKVADEQKVVSGSTQTVGELISALRKVDASLPITVVETTVGTKSMKIEQLHTAAVGTDNTLFIMVK